MATGQPLGAAGAGIMRAGAGVNPGGMMMTAAAGAFGAAGAAGAMGAVGAGQQSVGSGLGLDSVARMAAGHSKTQDMARGIMQRLEARRLAKMTIRPIVNSDVMAPPMTEAGGYPSFHSPPLNVKRLDSLTPSLCVAYVFKHHTSTANSRLHINHASSRVYHSAVVPTPPLRRRSRAGGKRERIING